MPRDNKLRPVYQVPAHELVVEQLQKLILLGKFLPGDRLPSERIMAEQLGVSRTSVREAIQMLVKNGLLVVKRGAMGGAFIQSLIADGKRKTLKQAAKKQRKFYLMNLEYRIAIECGAASLAAQRRTSTDIKRLQRCVQQMDRLFLSARATQDPLTTTKYYAEDSDFHIMIGRMSKNPFFADAIEKIRYRNLEPLGKFVPQLHENVNDGHQEIMDAIVDGDAAAADAHTRSHLGRAYDSLFGKRAG